MSSSEKTNRAQDTKENLNSVLGAHSGLAKAVGQLSLQTDHLKKAQTQADKNKPLSELKGLNEQLTKHAQKQNQEIRFVKDKMYEDFEKKFLSERDAYVKSQVKEEIARQAEEEVRKQIEQFLPVSLDRQAEEGQARIKKLKTALHNSEARTQNACIRVSDWLEPLKVVLKEDGEKGDCYPSDLTTVYNYDAETMRALLTSYKIKVDESDDWRWLNFNRFVQFIGVRGQLDGELE